MERNKSSLRSPLSSQKFIKINMSNKIPRGPFNLFARFTSPNPKTTLNPKQYFSKISKKAFVSPFASVIGSVTIKNNVYIAPVSSIRADEGMPFLLVPIRISKTGLSHTV